MNKRSINEGLLSITVALLAIGVQPPAFAQAPVDQSQPAPAAPASPPAAAAPTSAKVIYMGREMSYADPRLINKAVLTECQLPQQGGQLLEVAMRNAGFETVRDDQAVKAGKGRILVVEITDAISAGNAFIGHRKQVNVKGRLLEDGKEVASFVGSRSSMGGAFGGFKGSCAVLGRCLETLSKDISTWLRNPSNTRIGE